MILWCENKFFDFFNQFLFYKISIFQYKTESVPNPSPKVYLENIGSNGMWTFISFIYWKAIFIVNIKWIPLIVYMIWKYKNLIHIHSRSKEIRICIMMKFVIHILYEKRNSRYPSAKISTKKIWVKAKNENIFAY